MQEPIQTEWTPDPHTPYCAFRDPEFPSRYGWGKTPQEATQDFLRMEAEEACAQECDKHDSCQLANVCFLIKG